MKDKKEVLALIPARGGSKGVSRKNLRSLAGRPLIAHSIEAAKASRLITRIMVSTDDHEIAEAGRTHGAEVPFIRPAELAQDKSSEWLVWQHALHFARGEGRFPDVLVCVSPTSPMRSPADLDAAIEALLGGDADLVFAVTPSYRNPWYNMVVREADGAVRLVNSPTETVTRRQDAPETFDMTTVVYAAFPEFVLRSTSMWQGKVKSIVVPTERAIDIDTETDLKLAEFLMREREGKT